MTCGASVIGMDGMHAGWLNIPVRTMALVTNRGAMERAVYVKFHSCDTPTLYM